MTFAAALRRFFPASDGVTAKELSEFIKACTLADREQFMRELSEIFSEPVTLAS